MGAAPVVAATQPVPPSAQANGEKEFRLRGTSCLFTYNSPLFLVSAAREVWEAFSAFIAGLPFVSRWTATLEQSLHALDDGRVHLHAFVEFCHAVDWTSVALMVSEVLAQMRSPPELGVRTNERRSTKGTSTHGRGSKGLCSYRLLVGSRGCITL